MGDDDRKHQKAKNNEAVRKSRAKKNKQLEDQKSRVSDMKADIDMLRSEIKDEKDTQRQLQKILNTNEQDLTESDRKLMQEVILKRQLE